ncbi:MAG: DUF2975 domain-containing protein [Methanocorpusculum sp.]|uniref:DUF2975 domain-containing protein n=1 Tax=Methanocorpusculum sp. TaxID=2058474 RepID=UPI00271C8D04|nr:DUF2975 domain-containing protein [Methanocorpusculum sp.]MDO9522723.1 DUF2975 domain-containing protein [Methanocorpusculum sp.]
MEYNKYVGVISLMNATQIKIEHSARVADIVLKIARILGWIIIACMVLLLGGAAVIYGLAGSELFTDVLTSEDVTVLTAGGETGLTVGMIPGIIALFSIVSFAYMGLIMAILIVAGKIFSGIRKTLLPFTEENTNHLKTIAVLIAVISVVPALIELIGGAILGFSLDMFTFSIEGLVLAFVVYSLAHIFEYGLNLQEQADETL